MITFLASSPTTELNEAHPIPMLNQRNRFVELLKQVWPQNARCLIIAADPVDFSLNNEMTDYYRTAVINSGLSVACFNLCDARYPLLPEEDLRRYDVIFLAGGHVPTQRRWLEQLELRRRLVGFGGIVIGTSAGSMNAARTVYAWPEREGESIDPDYQLFFPGLGLAECNLLPHYQKVKDSGIDGKLYVQDIARSHSMGRRFLAVPDGSFVLAADGEETVFGEAYLVADGKIIPFCTEGKTHRFL